MSGCVRVTWVTDVPSKEEAPIVSTTRVVDKDKFPSLQENQKSVDSCQNIS
jgi:hypothetical protein